MSDPLQAAPERIFETDVGWPSILTERLMTCDFMEQFISERTGSWVDPQNIG